MKTLKYIFIFFLFGFQLQTTFSQNIQSITQSDINAVGQNITNLSIIVDDAIVDDHYFIHVDLNDQGIEYINTGLHFITVDNGIIENISGTLNDPIIEIKATDTQFELIMPRLATCTAYDLLSNGTLLFSMIKRN